MKVRLSAILTLLISLVALPALATVPIRDAAKNAVSNQGQIITLPQTTVTKAGGAVALTNAAFNSYGAKEVWVFVTTASEVNIADMEVSLQLTGTQITAVKVSAHAGITADGDFVFVFGAVNPAAVGDITGVSRYQPPGEFRVLLDNTDGDTGSSFVVDVQVIIVRAPSTRNN